jgi:protein-disulfide isomerase
MGPFGPGGPPPFVVARPARSGSTGLIVAVVVGLVMLLGVFGAGAFFLVRSKPGAPPISPAGASDSAYGNDEAWSDADASVPISSKDPSWGKRTAPVTLVVFEDFQCPFCARYRTALASVKETYGPDKVRIVWKHYPLSFHKDARPAAIAAEAVFRLGGSKAFWAFHDAAFANQTDLTQASFERWAGEVGVDVVKFRALQDDPAVAAKVDADAALAKTAGVQGTPNTFVNGFLMTGAQPLEKLTSLIDTEMASAQRAIAAGTPADRVYAKLSQENKTKNPAPSAKKEAEPEDEEKVWNVPVGDSPSLGPASAKVTVVMFSDFQCPFCKRALPTMKELREIYGSKIRIVWKHQPLAFHKQAGPAAQLSIEARLQKGDAGFWAAHDLLFKNQSNLSNEDLEAYAAELKLDVARVRKAILQEKHKAVIAEDQRLAEQVGAKGTPTFFINGHKLVGAQPVDKFKARIDRELAR